MRAGPKAWTRAGRKLGTRLRGRTPGRGDRRGFSLIELMIVVLIIGTVAGVAIPNLDRALLRARAVDALADLNSVRVAVLNYQSEGGEWPPDADRGVVPPGLAPYLPAGFSFDAEAYTIDYEEWSQSVGLVGLTIVTDNQDLGLMLLDLLGNNTWTNGTDKYTWVLEWTS